MTTRWTAVLVAMASGGAWAADALETVTVTASPLGDTPLQATRPVSVLRGTDLDRRRAVSLGDLLEGLPGVTSSGFSTAAGRPVVRGFAGPRVGVTENGLDTLDASTLSPDHAVVVDPLSVRQVEVLRGPATLRHGSGAIAGLVNAVSDLIPVAPQPGLRGDALLGGDSAARERVASVRLRGGTPPGDGADSRRTGALAWTLGGFSRDAGDYRIPGHAVAGDPTSPSGRLPNSFARAQGASGGVSWVDTWGVAGVSWSDLDTRYGIPAEDGVFVDLRNRRGEALLELDAPHPALQTLRVRTADVRYRHAEIESATGLAGTVFDSRGHDTRLEAVHEPVAGVRGVLGLHARERTLSASGEEAYLPSSREREDALFWVGERAIGDGRIEIGVRQARATRSPDAAAALPERRFDLGSWSVGGTVPVGGGLSLAVALSGAQRAPVTEELYANGPHAATRSYEIGDPGLGRERSRSLEVSLRRGTGAVRGSIGAFMQRFSSYVAGFATDEDGDGVPDRVEADGTLANSAADPGAGEYSRLAYRQAPARFSGLEAELSWRPAGTPWTLRTFGDAVRGTVDGLGDAPRLPPLRIGVSADYAAGPWAGFVSVLGAARQDRPGALESETPGHARVDAELAYTWSLGTGRQATLFLQGRNLTDADIRPSTSYVRDRVPMPGRSAWAGLRVRL
jgi:iron complex outermembrane receptor protein